MYYTSLLEECKEKKLNIMSIKKAEGKETAELATTRARIANQWAVITKLAKEGAARHPRWIRKGQ